MTLTLAAVYAPIGFLGGVTGTLFREFAFTLAGAVIISGIVAVTLSPMMCSLLLKRDMTRAASRGFDPHLLAACRSLWQTAGALARLPAGNGAVPAAVFVALAFMYLHTKAGWRRKRIRRAVRAGQGPYANLDYLNAYGDQLKGFTAIPEAELRFVVNGRFGPNQGIAGVILQPWGERSRSAQQIKPVMQQKVGAVEGMNAFVFSLPPLPASIGRLPVQVVIDSTGDFVPIYQAMLKIKDAARDGLFMVVDSDLDFNQPTIRSISTAAKPTTSASRCRRSATRWHCWSARITSTASISAAALSGDPAGAARRRLSSRR
jgi:multidrug efflux pump